MDVDLNIALDEMAESCLAVRLRRLNRVVTSLYDESLRCHGIGVGQLNLLVVVGRLGDPRASDVGGVLKMDQSTVSRNLKPLLRDGLLSAKNDENDSRAQRIRLTKKGRATVSQALPAWKAAQAKAIQLMGRSLAGELSRLAMGEQS